MRPFHCANGVVTVRANPSRRKNATLSRLKRPAFLLALVAYASFLAFGVAWYAAVWPPRPISRAWYDNRDRAHRPCCFQVFECGEDPADFEDLTCIRSADEYHLEGATMLETYATCGQLAEYRRGNGSLS